jgi:surface protein
VDKLYTETDDDDGIDYIDLIYHGTIFDSSPINVKDSVAEVIEGSNQMEVDQLNNTMIEGVVPGMVSLQGKFGANNAAKRIDISKWDVKNIINMRGMSSNCSNLEEFVAKNWDVSNVKDASGLFKNCRMLKRVDLTGWKLPDDCNTYGMFDGCVNLKNITCSDAKINNEFKHK